MSEFQIALLIGAVITALISFRLPRAGMWILLGAASFVVSTWYGRQGWPYPEAATAFSDAMVCFTIYIMARQRWELYLFVLFQGSLLVSISYLAGLIGPHWAYIAALEAINWAALGIIGGTSILSWFRDALGDHNHIVGYIRGVDRTLHAPIKTPFQRRD